jgi:hypothetical protein
MRLAGRKAFSALEWIVLFGLGVVAIGATEILGLPQRREDAIVYTVLVFATVVITFRPAWGRKAFWLNLAFIFALHVIAVVVILQVSPGPRSLPWLLLTGIGMAESVAIGGILWNRTVNSKSERSKAR